MSYRKYFQILFPVAVILLLDPSTASACSCGPKATVLDAYDRSDLVIIMRAVSVEKSDDRQAYRGISSTNMVVEKVFKGNLKPGEKMAFPQGGGADCVWTFDEEDIGKQFLFYLRIFKNAPVWIGMTCGRSRSIEYATDDLLYLNNMAKLKGKTRLSGTLSFYQSSPFEDGEPIYKRLSGKKVQIIGKNKSYEVTTDQDGVYEIYDLPAASYEIEPEIPVGWKVDLFRSRGSVNVDKIESDKNKDNVVKRPQRTGTVEVLLQAGRHAYVDVDYAVNSAIRGTVFDTQGNPLNGVCVDLIPALGKKSQYFHKSDCSEKEGVFALDDIPPGSYILVINDDGKISSDEPFPKFYYPNALQREKAAIISIGEGETIGDLSVHAPSMAETIVVNGVFLYGDGKPVVNERVEFEPESASTNIDGEAQAKTDAQGRFSIKILKGLKGQLYGAMYTYVGEFENCPQLDKAVKQMGSDVPELKTPALRVISESNQYDVELKYSFPGCKKAKH